MDSTPHSIATYLSLPDGFGPKGGLIWAKYGDCLEQADSQTFIFTKQLADFLEGFASVQRVLHFGHMLECWRMLGMETPADAPQKALFRRLAIAFRQQNSPARNAGSFFAKITTGVARAEKIHAGGGYAVAQFLAQSNELGLLHPKGPGNTEQPDRNAAELWSLVGDEISKLNDDELRQAFRHGSPAPTTPIEPIVELIEQKPKTVGEFFDEAIAERERFKASLPQVRQLVAALTLPPRRLDHQKLPVGGYADVINRGRPERLLLSQFALDPDEFVRRFAENELLYYRKEDPHERERETLSLILDQGVRTWGSIRQTLTAALIAFTKVAEKNKLPLTIRVGSRPNQRYAPPTDNAEEFGNALEASDLSLTPSEVLLQELINVEAGIRDVVLLTHPFSLNDPEIIKLSLLIPPAHRLFALTVDESTDVRLTELKGAGLVDIRKIRIIPEPTGSKQDVPRQDPATQYQPWVGDIEHRVYPFRFGPTHGIQHLCFDVTGEHLLISTSHGYLYQFNLARQRYEILPRGVCGGPLTDVLGLVGLQSGYLVVGKHRGKIRAFFYRQKTRTVSKHELMNDAAPSEIEIIPFADSNSCIIRHDNQCWALHATTGELITLDSNTNKLPRVGGGAFSTDRVDLPAVRCLTISNDHSESQASVLDTLVRRLDGSLDVWFEGDFHRLTPLSDGKPIYEREKINKAWLANATIAISSRREQNVLWRLIDIESDRLLSETLHPHVFSSAVALSKDGKKFAFKNRDTEATVISLKDGGAKIFTPRSNCHSNTVCHLGRHSLTIVVGKFQYELFWAADKLTLSQSRIATDAKTIETSQPTYADLLLQATFGKSWSTEIDPFGQIFMFDLGELMACILVYQKNLCFWLPDGTRYGPAHVTGGPETPDAMMRFWRVVKSRTITINTSHRSAK